MATLESEQPFKLTCPSCHSDTLNFRGQQIVVHSEKDTDRVHPENPLETGGDWVAITLRCEDCNKNCYIATGNSNSRQMIGVFPGDPAFPEQSDNFAVGNGWGSVVVL